MGSIIATLRAGDVVGLSWLRDGGSENERNAGLHHDEVRLEVNRGGRKLVFSIHAQCYRDNTARMTRLA